MKGKKVIERTTGNKKAFKVSKVKSWLCCSIVLYNEKKKTNIPKPVMMNLKIFSTCLCSGFSEAKACIAAEKTRVGTIINSLVRLNVKKLMTNSIAIVNLIVSKNTFLKYVLLFTLLILINETNPKPIVQIKVSLSKEMSQSASLYSRKTYREVCKKKAKSDKEIFHPKRAVTIRANDCRMSLLNMQAASAIKIQIVHANSLVEKLSNILSIYFLVELSISGVVR